MTTPAELLKQGKIDECLEALLQDEYEMPDRSMYTDDELSLCTAIKTNNIQLASQLLQKGTSTDIYDDQGFCLLVACVEAIHMSKFKNNDMLTILLTKCDPNQVNFHDKGSPIQLAAFFGRPDLVKILGDAGADPDYKNTAGFNAHDFAK